MIHHRPSFVSIFFSLVIAGALTFFCFFSTTPDIYAQGTSSITACSTDINFDGITDITDYSILVSTFFKEPITPPRADINQDGIVDIQDYSALVNFFLEECSVSIITPTPLPTLPPQADNNEWSQHGHDPQRTSYSPVDIPTPWKYAWEWNGADGNGKRQANHLSVPRNVQPITGGGRVYIVADNSVIALQQSTGTQLWRTNGIGGLQSSAAYLNEAAYVGSSDGKLYKLDAGSGQILGNFSTSGAITAPPLIANNQIYVGNANGHFYAVKPDLTKQWEISLGSSVVVPAAFSQTKNILIVNTQDLNVHALNANDGSQKWKVKPTSRSYQSGDPNQDGAQFEAGWPVIAEQHGIVFVRYRLDWNTLWTWSPYPNTNSMIRANLESQADQQALFALSLDDGSKKFIPAVGNGGAGDGGYLPMGTQPVVKHLANGQEVAYIIWRNGLACGGCSTAGNCGGQWCDGRSDATMGEMVLDDYTVSGYQAGDVRFVRAIEIRTDEMMNISMAGNTIFHSHWLINSAHRITDRNANKGNTFSNPIETTNDPFVIWRQCNGTNTCNYPGCTTNTVCGISCAPTSSRYCSQGLYSYGDSRSYPPGFYEYNNDMNSGSTPFTIAAGSTILVKTNDGAIMAFVNGNPTANTNSVNQITQVSTGQQVLGATSLPQIVPEDALKYVNQLVTVEGSIKSVVNNLPKAIYLGFSNPHDGNLLLRIFDKDTSKFGDLPFALKNKKVRVTGKVQLYWPEGVDPEIVVTDPGQLEIIE